MTGVFYYSKFINGFSFSFIKTWTVGREPTSTVQKLSAFSGLYMSVFMLLNYSFYLHLSSRVLSLFPLSCVLAPVP